MWEARVFRRRRDYRGLSRCTRSNISGCFTRTLYVQNYSANVSQYTKNPQQSALLRLPAELRNRIYDSYLGGMEIHIGGKDSRNKPVCFRRPKHSSRHSEADWHQWCFPPLALTQVCKQLHGETSTLILTLNEILGSGDDILSFLLQC
jgi:hypothetical protein